MPYTALQGINDPQDPAFRGDFLTQLQPFIAGHSDDEVTRAIEGSSFYGKLGSGSNPYLGAVEVGLALGDSINFDQAASDNWRKIAEDRSPEGIARAQDSGGGFFSSLIKLAPIAAAVALAQPELAAASTASDAVAIGSEFGVQGDIAGTLAGGGLGSEFGVQGPLQATLTGGSSSWTLSDAFSGLSAVNSVVNTTAAVAKALGGPTPRAAAPASSTSILMPPAQATSSHLLVLPSTSSAAIPAGQGVNLAGIGGDMSSTGGMIVAGVGIALVLGYIFTRLKG